ncbi:putative dimethylaniline protein [Botrytis fragariae]|uniref:Putative dimethylaniline protein n=1 Tax=Botrytis fragariae TaxID=1964551 RepID=A0A8H6EIZ7_9HELO|nr:putative dimethylaniline protein [Botrytis fragariae]KAF5874019.1 putative dimethylaniline protein [Botrytis fragariae]
MAFGAGISGIIAAQRHLDAHPDCCLALLVVFLASIRRVYSDSWAQWSIGLAEFSHFSVKQPLEKDLRNNSLKAEYTTEYLEQYANQETHARRSLCNIHSGVHIEFITKPCGSRIRS